MPTGFRKYIWAAIFWLLVSETALLTFTIYEALSGAQVSHALFRGVPARHIHRVHQHDDPRLRLQDDPAEQRGKNYAAPKLLNATFLLVNVGVRYVSCHNRWQSIFILNSMPRWASAVLSNMRPCFASALTYGRR